MDHLRHLFGRLREPGPDRVRNSLLFSVLMAVTIIEIALNWGRKFPDTPVYAEIARYGRSSLGPSVDIRFLIPYLAHRLTQMNRSLSLVGSFALLNSLFWVGSTITAYKIGTILGKPYVGFLMGMFVTTSTAELGYGAAALTDSATYFFAGFALLVVLRTKYPSRLSSTLEGAIVSMGPFFHPAAALAMIYGLTFGARRGWRMVWVLFGASAVLLTAIIVAFGSGWLGELFSRGGAFLNVLPYYRTEPPDRYIRTNLVQGLTATFDIYRVFQYQLEGLSSLTSAILPGLSGPELWFLIVLLVGFWKTPHKWLLLIYLPVLLLYDVVVEFAIDRFLFFAWPFFAPVLVYGILTIARVPAGAMKLVLSKPALRKVGILTNPAFYAAIYIILYAIENTQLVTIGYHISPPA